MNLREFQERAGGRPDKFIGVVRQEAQAAALAELGRLAARYELRQVAVEGRAAREAQEQRAAALGVELEQAQAAVAAGLAEYTAWQRVPESVLDLAGNDARRARLQRLRTAAGALEQQQVGAAGRAADLRALVALVDGELTAPAAAPHLAEVFNTVRAWTG